MTSTSPLVLLDLDGTLTDSAPVIRDGLRRTFVAMGLPAPDDAALVGVVGPGLPDGLALAGMPPGRVPEAIDRYRTWYRAEGVRATVLFAGVEEQLRVLVDAGCTLAVATSKPEPLARLVTARVGLDRWLTGVYGAPPDDVPSTKAGVVGHALAGLGPLVPAPERTAMVGDRVHDAVGAAAHGLRCLLVAWGAAPAGELASAAAIGVVDRVGVLAATVLAAVAADG